MRPGETNDWHNACQRTVHPYNDRRVNFWTKIGLPVLLMMVFAMSRWPGVMPDNFSAVYALVFCGGVFLPRKLAWWLPLATLFVTDLLLNAHYVRLYEANLAANPDANVAPVEFFNPYLLANYASYAVLIWLGSRFKPTAHWLKLAGGGVLGALGFYLISNTASWLQLPGYAKTLTGWIQALTLGLPGFPPTWVFFLKTLISGGLFTGLFVGAMKFATREVESPEAEADEKPVEDDARQPEESQA